MVIFELLGHRKVEKAAVPRDASGSQSLDGVVVFMGDGGLLWNRLEQKDEQGFGWYLETPSGSHSIHVARASEDGAKRRHDRYSPGLHHLAWKVDSRAEVDRMHERLLSVGATILDPPAEYPQYNKGRGYYVADGENDVVDKPSHVTDAPSPLHAGVVSRETLPKPYQTLTSQEHVAGKRSMRFRGRAQALPTRT